MLVIYEGCLCLYVFCEKWYSIHINVNNSMITPCVIWKNIMKYTFKLAA